MSQDTRIEAAMAAYAEVLGQAFDNQVFVTQDVRRNAMNAALAAADRLAPATAAAVEADQHVRLIAAAPELLALLILIDSGLKRGKIKDVSIVPPIVPGATECDLTSLSEMVRAAICKAGPA